jgi:hypothetical protein
MKMIYRKLSKTASPPVTCHPASAFCRSDESRLLKGGTVSGAPKNHNKTVAMFKQRPERRPICERDSSPGKGVFMNEFLLLAVIMIYVALISHIPDFVSLTNTGTEQVLTPHCRLQCVICPDTLIGGEKFFCPGAFIFVIHNLASACMGRH